MTLQPVLPGPWAAVLTVVALAVVVAAAVRGPHRGRWAVRGLAVLAGVAMLLGPAVPRHVAVEAGSALDVFVVVDRTGSMAAQDWDGDRPRLDGVRHDVTALADALPGARFSILGWDTEAVRQLPLTTDVRAVRAWAQTVRQEITTWSTGSTLDRPLDALTATLERARERDPDHVRLVFLLTDGEQTAGDERRSFDGLADLVDGGAVLGYGTAEGGPMREYDGALVPDLDAPWIPDPDDPSSRALSRLDEQVLREVADEIGVPYVHRTGPDDAVGGLVADVDAAQVTREVTQQRTTWSPVVWPFAAVVALVLCGELVVSVRELPLRRLVRRREVAP